MNEMKNEMGLADLFKLFFMFYVKFQLFLNSSKGLLCSMKLWSVSLVLVLSNIPTAWLVCPKLHDSVSYLSASTALTS